MQLLKEVADEDGFEFGFNASHTPEARWVIEVLGTLRPECYIFDKGYVPGVEIPIEMDQGAGVAKKIDNADGFWTGQPLLGGIKNTKGGYSVMNRLHGDTIEDKIARAQQKLAAQQERIVLLETKRQQKGAKRAA